MPAVGANDELGAHLEAALRRPDLDTDHAAPLLEEAHHLGAHPELEGRVAGRLLREKVQEVPLGQERDEPAARRQMGEVGERHRHVADLHGQLVHLLVRQLQEVLQQPELVHDLERGRMDRVAAEVAQEVGVLLEHEDLDACVGEEQPEHHPGRPSAGDATGRREGGHGSGRRECPRPWPRRRHVENRHVEKSGSRWPGGRLATASSSVRAWRHSLAGRTYPFVPTWSMPQ